MKADNFVKNPPETLQAIIKEVQKAANATQSEAVHYHEAGDGSVVEIRCAPDPAYRGELPEITENNDGFLAEKGGKLFKAIPIEVARSSDPAELLPELADSQYRTLYTLAPPVEDPTHADDGTLEVSGEPRGEQEYAVVEFQWQEVDHAWSEHAVKKAADVRLRAHTSARAAAVASVR